MLARRIRHGASTIVLSLVLAAPSWADTLTDAFIQAYRTSGLLEQNRALVRAADEDVAQAVAALRPVLNYVARTTTNSPGIPGTPDTDFVMGLSAELLLYDSGASRYAIDAAKEAVLAAREALRGVEQQVLFRAASSYFNVRRAEAFVDLGAGSVRVITQELRAANDRFEVGEVTRTDVAIAEARLAASRSTFAAAQGELAQAREEYKAVVGDYPGPTQPPPAPPPIVGSLEEALDVARRMHPAIDQAQREALAAEINVLRAEASIGPSLTGSVDLTWDETFGDDRRQYGLTFGGPIYRGGELASVVRQARARRDAARSGVYEAVRDVERQVGIAWSVLNVTAASIEAGRREVEAADVALRGTQEESRLGARTTLDVLNAEQELLDARANLVAAEIDRQIAVYGLWRSMGLLTVEQLGLGIATYDPADYYTSVEDAPVRNVSPRGEKLDSVLRRLLR